MVTLPPNVVCLLKKAYDNGTNEENYTFEIQQSGELPEGCFGERIYVTLINNCSGERTHTIVKRNIQSRYYPADFMRAVFKNEILFYGTIWKKYQQIQNSNVKVEEFTSVPHCYGICPIAGEEQLLFHNIKQSNFQHLTPNHLMDKEHLAFAFKTYGKFHALSFALSRIEPDEFSRIVNSLNDTLGTLIQNPTLCACLKKCFRDFIPYFEKKHADPQLINKLKVYSRDVSQLLADCLNYRGKHGVICHSDCWSTRNLMFRYHKTMGFLTNMALVNFQLMRYGSPVLDLATFLYSGAEKNLINILDSFLKIYYESLSQFLQQFGLNPQDIYPYSALLQEWREYSKFGFIMGFILWNRKLYKSEAAVITNGNNQSEVQSELSDEDKLTRIRRDHIVHMFENGFL